MTKLPADPIVISLLSTTLTVLGCGVTPAGQVSTRNFVVTGFTLPVAMVYTNMATISAQHLGTAGSKDGARHLYHVFDVLEQNGRRALLPNAVISSILAQLNVTIIYEPMQCQKVFSDPVAMRANVMRENCIIVDNTVTRICTVPMPLPLNNNMMCDTYVAVIPPRHLTIGELISTTNIIMANWSRTMWQSVVSRAVRVLASGPFGLNFASASAVVSGN
ncbi:hypothetical protein KIN20_018968 [Parelaphostrongylus tenuis]|uniref:Uncharacterized protein n=1 Tax=Parelaphostrongylus tenuis TaxID=148309 RepID=A0AAD5N2L4_PARTN|nr:hypothetical protein KIN20_018968 [Parelaphostrongylus tenuis]